MDHMDNYDRASEIPKSLPPEVAEILFSNFSNGQTDPKSLISCMMRWPEVSPRTLENFDPEPRWFLDNDRPPHEHAKELLNFDQDARRTVKSLQEADTVEQWKEIIDTHDNAFYLLEPELDRLRDPKNGESCGIRFWAEGILSILLPRYIHWVTRLAPPRPTSPGILGEGVRRLPEHAVLLMGKLVVSDAETRDLNRVDPQWVIGAFDALANECRRRLLLRGIEVPEGLIPEDEDDVVSNHHFEEIVDVIREVLFLPRGPTEGDPLHPLVPEVRCPTDGFGMELEGDSTRFEVANYCIDLVMQRRKGVSHSLAFIYCAIGRRLGVHINVADKEEVGNAYALAVNKTEVVALGEGEAPENPYQFICIDVFNGGEKVPLTVLDDDPPTSNPSMENMERFAKQRYMQARHIFLKFADKIYVSEGATYRNTLTETKWRAQELNDLVSKRRFRMEDFLLDVHPALLGRRRSQRLLYMKTLKTPEYLPFRNFNEARPMKLPSTMRFSIGSVVKRAGKTGRNSFVYGVVIDCIHEEVCLEDREDEEISSDEDSEEDDDDDGDFDEIEIESPQETESQDPMVVFVRNAIERNNRLIDVEECATLFIEQDYVGMPLPKKDITFSILLSPQGGKLEGNVVSFHSRGVAVVDESTLEATSFADILAESDDPEKTTRELEFLDFECGRYFSKRNDQGTQYIPNGLTKARFNLN